MTRRDPGFDSAAYAAAHPDTREHFGTDHAVLVRHWNRWGRLEGRIPFGLAPYRDRLIGRRFWRRADAVTVYGFFDARSGLGTSARAYRAAIEGAGYRVTPVTLVQDGIRIETRPDLRPRRRGLLPWKRPGPEGLATKVNVFALNADVVHRFFLDGRRTLLDDSYNIGIWFWELAAFPTDWAGTFGAFDEIWVASGFCRDAIGAVSPIPVIRVPMPVEPPPDPASLLPRSHFGLPDDVFLFGCLFDVGSVVRRKNPLAAVEAFRAAFGDSPNAMLVLKYHGTEHYPEAVAPLLRAARGHANIRLVDRSFDAHETASFRQALDALVSPHRSEGFGLNLAETMAAGRPVIATAASGNQDFMSERDSYPVRWRLAEVGPDAGAYPADALWADPDGADLARQMRRVFEDRPEAARRSAEARRRIATEHGVAAAAPVIRERLDRVFAARRPDGPPPGWGAGTRTVSRYRAGDQPRISLVAPSGPDADDLAATLEAVLAQSHANWELVLAPEPGSSVECLAVLERYRGRDARLKIPPAASRAVALTLADVLALTTGRSLALPERPGPMPPGALTTLAAALRAEADPAYELRDGSGDRAVLVALPRRLLLATDGLHGPYTFAGLLGLAREAAGGVARVIHIA